MTATGEIIAVWSNEPAKRMTRVRYLTVWLERSRLEEGPGTVQKKLTNSSTPHEQALAMLSII
jgi:hypothetical protein